MSTTQQIIEGKMKPTLRKKYPDNHFDACVTDPPYGLKFMGKKWDYKIPSIAEWREVWRVLKPGAHMLVACGTRTQHRMACNIEDAGFEIRDVISWIYGQGFPKSLDIGKAINKAAGVEREVIGKREHPTLADKSKVDRQANPHFQNENSTLKDEWDLTAPATDAAKAWDGWGTALKPATEFWTVCRKPLDGTTVAENVLKWGVGGLNIDACRISFQDPNDKDSATWGRGTDILGGNYVGGTHGNGKTDIEADDNGRWPANVILDEAMGAELDKQAPQTGAYAPIRSGQLSNKTKNAFGVFGENGDDGRTFHDEGVLGGASRFFYCPKPDNYERNKGLKGFEPSPMAGSNQAKAELKRGNTDFESENDNNPTWSSITMRQNSHPTVKPIDLMRWLVKLICPKGGLVLDPFNGSGSTGIAAKLELMNYIGIEQAKHDCDISRARIAAWNPDRYKEQTLF